MVSTDIIRTDTGNIGSHDELATYPNHSVQTPAAMQWLKAAYTPTVRTPLWLVYCCCDLQVCQTEFHPRPPRQIFFWRILCVQTMIKMFTYHLLDIFLFFIIYLHISFLFWWIKMFGLGIGATSVLTLLTPIAANGGVTALVVVRFIEGVFEVNAKPWSWVKCAHRNKVNWEYVVFRV